MTDPLPCPFCGSKRISVGASLEDSPTQWSVICNDCGSSCSLYCRSMRDAITSWNTRAQLASPLRVRDAALEECAKLVEQTALTNPTNIARDIRALASSLKEAKS